MACLLQPECNFLHGFFRCKLLVEVVDVEVNVTSLQGMHIANFCLHLELIRITYNLQSPTSKRNVYIAFTRNLKQVLRRHKVFTRELDITMDCSSADSPLADVLHHFWWDTLFNEGVYSFNTLDGILSIDESLGINRFIYVILVNWECEIW